MNKENNDFFINDKLGIKPYVMDFANLVKQETYTEGGCSRVYSISAEFGGGKTFFCDALQHVLNQDSVPVAKLNIWEMDFYDSPLIPLLIKIKDIYEQNNFKHSFKEKLQAIWCGIKSLSIVPIKLAFRAHGFDIDQFIDVYEKLSNKSDIYDNYQEYESEITKLKGFLGKWARRASQPIVVIIDELDRCRPDYAVKTLEILKHFFDIPGFVFILAIDEEQLKSSVKTLFGTEKFDGYKRKFINNLFLLPKPDKEKFTNYLYEKSGINSIIEKIEKSEKDLVFKARRDKYKDYINQHFMGIDNAQKIKEIEHFNELQTCKSIVIRYFAAYSIWFQFSLRQMEQVFDRLVLFTKEISGSSEFFSPDLAVFLVCLHEFDLKLFEILKSSQDKVYGRHGGVLYNIYAQTNKDSYAYKLYGDKAIERFGELKRSIVQTVPLVDTFSGMSVGNDSYVKYIIDNLDRFFKVEDGQDVSLKWLLETEICGQCNIMNNNKRIALVQHDRREERWKKIPDDIVPDFNLEKFRNSYFEKMNFLSNFS